MRNDIYRQLVSIIDRHRTWIEVVAANPQEVATVERYGRTYTTVCRTLVLEVFRTGRQYDQHHRWSITEFELDKALAAYRKHLRNNRKGDDKRIPLQLTPKDVDEIIRVATHDVVHLRLTEEPLFTYCKDHKI